MSNQSTGTADRDEWLESRDILQDTNTEKLIGSRINVSSTMSEDNIVWAESEEELRDVSTPLPSYISGSTMADLSDKAVFVQAMNSMASMGSDDATSLGANSSTQGRQGPYKTATFGIDMKAVLDRDGSVTSECHSRDQVSLDGLDLMSHDELMMSLDDESLGIRSRFGRKRLGSICLILGGAVALTLGLVFGLTYSGAGNEIDELVGSEAPSLVVETDDLFKLIFSTGTTSSSTLFDPMTPQAKAFEWLDASRIDGMPNWKLLQRYAMATLYHSTGSENWIENDKWLSEKDECNWFSGVDVPCDNQGNLVFLSLSQNGLSGAVPPELGLLVSLKEIDIVGGTSVGLTGTLPETLRNLRNLETLNLRYQKLSGVLSNNLVVAWPKLRHLDLSFNQLEGSLPPALGSLVGIHNVHLANNRFSGPIPQTFSSGNFYNINLHYNQLTGVVPAGKWPNLRTLILSENEFSAFEDPVEAPKLTKLRLCKNNIAGDLPTLEAAPKLGEIALKVNLFEGQIPHSWGSLKSLTLVDLANNSLTGVVPSHLTKSGILETLHVQGNDLDKIICPAGVKPLDWSADCRAEEGEIEIECTCCTHCCADGMHCHKNTLVA